MAKAGLDPLEHYLTEGAWELRNPNPQFDSQWYLDRYPEVAASGVNPLIHYLETGGEQRYDPHPLFDTQTYLQVCGRLPPGVTPLEAFIAGGRSAVAGAYRSVESLQAVQQGFLDRVSIEIIADRRKQSARYAVFLQCGAASLHPVWLTGKTRAWHLIANMYDDSYTRPIDADLVMAQNQGSKFSAIYRILEDNPGFFDAYDYVLFLDDDILVAEEQIERLFRIVDSLSLKLAQPAVQHGSANTWPDLLQQKNSIGRYLNAVEIMMPVLSRDALALGGHLFRHSISGWGLDFALGNLITRTCGMGLIAVIDAVSFLHAKEIDVFGGAYYRMLRHHGISPLVEERSMELHYGARGPIMAAC